MKKLVVTMLALFTCTAAYALPVGNPSEASLFENGVWWDDCYSCDPCDPCFSWCDAWSLRVGFYGDYVFNRHMEVDSDNHGRGADIDDTELFTNAGYIALNICDRVDIFGTLGSTSISVRTGSATFVVASVDDPSHIAEIAFSPDFSWSVGARGTLWECDCFALGVEGQYFQTNPDIDFYIGRSGDITYFNSGTSSRYWEWQVGLGASYRFATNCPTFAMVPYAAVKWAHSKFALDDFTFARDAGNPATLPTLEAKKLWGYAVGMSLTLCDMIGANVEARFGDEKAVSVNTQFRF